MAFVFVAVGFAVMGIWYMFILAVENFFREGLE